MPSFREIVLVWLKVAALSFGGPANQIAVMHRLLVEEKKWVSEDKFLQALNYCMLLPGPEAHQLAIYLGLLTYGLCGSILAGVLFVIPGFVSILIISVIYVSYHQTIVFQNFLVGLKAVVIAIVIEALTRIGKRALKSKIAYIVAGGSFLLVFCLKIPFPFILLGAAIIGLIHNNKMLQPNLEISSANQLVLSKQTLKRAVFIGIGLWVTPLLLLINTFGQNNIFTQQGIFFSKVSLLTFGGAYAVLGYVTQQVVEFYHWVTPTQMLDGLGFAETTPGPLIQVVQFVAFVSAYNHFLDSSPLTAGIIGSIITVWVTFLPSFIWIFAGAPYIEKLSSNQRIQHTMSMITAAILGVIANLVVWFSVHSYFSAFSETTCFSISFMIPHFHSIHWDMVFITLLSLFLLLRFKVGLFLVIGIAVTLGFIFSFLVNLTI